MIPFPKGPTATHNIDGDCEHHHHLKHDNYTVTRNTNGTRTWTTPLGRQYTTKPHEY